jgi:CubicO group peptidase (beta-lactamase class C family)
MLRRTFCMALPLGVSAQSLSLEDETSGLIRRAVDDGTIPGTVARIEQEGRSLADSAAGWRDIENRSPMRTDTIFDVRSITKPVTAIAVLSLVAEEKLSLDGTVEEHIPEVASLRASAPITLRHLLTHTAGLVHERPPELQDLTEKRDCALEDVVAILTRGQLIAQPGER